MQRFILLLLAIAVAKASVSVTRTSNDGPHPSSMEIEVQLPNSNKKVRIPLTKTDPLENTPMTVTENGISRTFSARQAQNPDHAHYRNIETRSVISVRHENDKKRIKGHVMHEGTSYFVEPSGEFEHRVTENVAQPTGIESHIENALKRKKRQANQKATEFEVELHILCDNTVWNVFKTIYGTDDKATTELHFYFSHILTGMDTVYRNIRDPSMSVKCIGFTVAKTEADSKWMPPSGSSDGNNAAAMLETIKAYAKDNVADHVMGFTRIDIHNDGNSAVAGMAFISRACSESKVSIVEDKGLHSWGCASHELAHNLGAADHDNDEPDCKMSMQYLMSPAAGSYDQSNIANSYRFSPCTVRAIKNYLDSGKANCLKTRQGTSISQLTSSAQEGARMTLNQVCRLAFPSSPGIFFLTDAVQKTPALMCTRIYCSMKKGDRTGLSHGGFRAPVGSSCGNKKSCNWNGQCVADSAAPEADESCFFGDQWGDVCAGWTGYIKYLRDNNAIADAMSYCAQSLSHCCQSLKTLCQF